LVTLNDILNKTQYKRNATLQFASTALESFNKSISFYDQRIEALKQELNSTKLEIQNSQSNLERAINIKNTLIERLNNLTQRWKEIQSPFGTLPIDFTNLLAIFPLGLSSGFLLCSMWLAESIRLRRLIHFMRDDNEERKGENLKNEKVYHIAPLWIDPPNPNQNRTARLLLLAIPFVIFILSVEIISYTWEHAPSTPFPAASDVNKNLYYAVYAAGIGMFVYSFWLVISEVRHYK
jgi:hypothetical protein